jgi:hypothetical protein
VSAARDESIMIAGLPGSGKTTFLAALWHLVTERDEATALALGKLIEGDVSHLNAIAAQWRNAKVQERTPANRRVLMSLEQSGKPMRLGFPDVSGEVFVRMWEDRDCDPDLVSMLQARSVALFVHSDTIQAPRWVIDEVALAEDMGIATQGGPVVEWTPRSSPTQVQLVDILQSLRSPPLDVGPRRLAVMLSAWDKAEGEQMPPDAFLAAKLPLLDQYLRQDADGWAWRVYGISAQGGDYDAVPPDKPVTHPSAAAEALRSLDRASQRIRVVHGTQNSHDLTEPLAWLMS